MTQDELLTEIKSCITQLESLASAAIRLGGGMSTLLYQLEKIIKEEKKDAVQS